MDLNKLLERTKLILTSPTTEWNIIEAEETSIKKLYLSYILILAAITPIAGFIKMSVFGIRIPFFGTYRLGIGTGISDMILNYLFTLVGIYLMAIVIDMLAPSFGGNKDQLQAFKTVTYAYTAAWVTGIFQLIPWIGIPLLLAGLLYSVYLLYLGLPVTMKCPTEKSLGYTAVSTLIAIIFSFVISTVAGNITGAHIKGNMGQSGMSNQGSFDKNSVGGKIENWSKKLEQAGKEMEQAQKSGDVEQQKKAAKKMMATAMGSNGTIETLAPDRIKAFLPEKLGGMTRTNASAQRGGAMGFQISTATASYPDRNGHTLKIDITDMGLAKGVMALAGWAGVEQDKTTANGFEKTYKQGSRMVHERWNDKSHSGTYTIIVANRFSVEISGNAKDINTLKNMAQDLNLSGLEALKDEGISQEKDR